MDILEFAMKMEMDGKRFYERGADATDDPGMKKILLTLAEEENRHFEFFRQLKTGEVKPAKAALGGPSQTVSITKNVFQEMVESGSTTLAGDDIKELWKEAIVVEEKSEKMYRDEAEKETDPERKELLNRIADEEKNHIYLIDNMIHYLADPQGFAASQNYASFKSWEGR